MLKLTFFLLAIMTNSAFARASGEEIRYVAIGDSYSIGEGATPEESWPALLARHLTAEGINTALVANPSVTGWTTQQAIDHELSVFRAAKPTFATLLIGVNDWVQGVSARTFRNNLCYLIDQMLAILPTKDRLLVVTIPDFSVTPKGPKYARGRNISEGIASFNEIIMEEAMRRGLRTVNIFEVSKSMHSDATLVAVDGLHPSAKAYAQWERVIFPKAFELLKGSPIPPGR
jgi:lysophospholipase L1-like esterase